MGRCPVLCALGMQTLPSPPGTAKSRGCLEQEVLPAFSWLEAEHHQGGCPCLTVTQKQRVERSVPPQALSPPRLRFAGDRRSSLLGVRKRLVLRNRNAPGGCHEHTLGSIPWA